MWSPLGQLCIGITSLILYSLTKALVPQMLPFISQNNLIQSEAIIPNPTLNHATIFKA